ncbi:MAG TPA: hypothetical protein VIK61_17610 [Acidimicrobiia bacterium]
MGRRDVSCLDTKVVTGFTWSTTVIMEIELVGPARRGFAMGHNEAAG